HVLTLALGHRGAPLDPDQVDELLYHDLEGVGFAAERRAGGLQARDVAVVIGAPDVYEPLKSAFTLVLEIGDVGGEVGVVAARAHEHAILVVAVGARAQPQRAV